MAVLSEIYIPVEKLKILAVTVQKKGEKGISLIVSINDKVDQYAQNVSAHVKQTKEQQEAKKDRFYVGNGRVFWKNEEPVTIPSKDKPVADVVSGNDDDLPL